MESVSGLKMPFLVEIKSVFSVRERRSAAIPAAISPIAGAEESPGDSMPATLIKPFASSASPMMKSLPSSCARRPANEVITWRIGTFLTLNAAVFARESSPSCVVLTASLFVTSTAVGPTKRLPCTVGVTSTPFPILDGSWKIVCDTCVPASLSSRQYSPLRAVI